MTESSTDFERFNFVIFFRDLGERKLKIKWYCVVELLVVYYL